MKGKRVEDVFDNIHAKLDAGIPLTKEDLVPLTLCPLMGGDMSQEKRIIKAFDITRLAKEQQGMDVEKIEAVVYAMAEKFLDSVTIEELKEAVGMTRLGQMMYNDGVEKTKLEIAQKLLGILDDVQIAEKTGLSLEVVQKLHEEDSIKE